MGAEYTRSGYFALGPYYIIRPQLKNLKTVKGMTPPMWVAHMHSDRDTQKDAMTYLFPQMIAKYPPGGFTM